MTVQPGPRGKRFGFRHRQAAGRRAGHRRSSCSDSKSCHAQMEDHQEARPFSNTKISRVQGCHQVSFHERCVIVTAWQSSSRWRAATECTVDERRPPDIDGQSGFEGRVPIGCSAGRPTDSFVRERTMAHLPACCHASHRALQVNLQVSARTTSMEQSWYGITAAHGLRRSLSPALLREGKIDGGSRPLTSGSLHVRWLLL